MQAQDVLAITVWWWVVMLREIMTSIHFFKSWFYSIFKKSKTSSALAGSLWFQDQNEPLLLSPSQPSQPGWCLVVSNLLIGYAGLMVEFQAGDVQSQSPFLLSCWQFPWNFGGPLYEQFLSRNIIP